MRKLRLHCTKNEVFHYGFSSKCDQIRRKLCIWSHLLKKSVMENFIFCAALLVTIYYLQVSYNDMKFKFKLECPFINKVD